MSVNFQNPLVIGALGGSGTRVVASIFIEAGVYMGSDLNKPNDNLVFTRLFKHPQWKKNATSEEISFRLSLFEKYMTGNAFGTRERNALVEIMKKNPRYLITPLYAFRLRWRKKHNATMWGWKEPNSQLYMEDLAGYFPNMRYIQVVRNGLDMAFSRNVQQLTNWGAVYGVEKPEDHSEMPTAQLEYWIRATNDVLEKGKRLLGDRFYVLNYDKLWAEPSVEVPRLLEFASLEVAKEMMDFLISLPQKPSSAGRFRSKDLSVFSKGQIDAVIELGFETQ